MDYLIVCLSALVAFGLTLFSGFGLGTLLVPVFSLFFPVAIAVALTAVVHLLNNLFKLVLLGKQADKKAVIHFGLPAILTSLLGAWILLWLSDLQPLFTYTLFEHRFSILPVKFAVALLMVVFSLLELIPSWEKVSFDKKYLVLGGFLSGFFGGLSGHQGALRSAFLVKSGSSKQAFIASGVVIAVLVDISRLSVYSAYFSLIGITQNSLLLAAATLSAFLGAFIGNRMLGKVTLRLIQYLVAIMMFFIALGLGTGLI